MNFTSAAYSEEQIAAEHARFITKVYAWMSGGLAITALVAWFVAQTPALYEPILLNRPVFFGLIILELVMVGALVGFVQKMNAATAGLIFTAYSALNGLTMSVIFLVFTLDSIFTTFLITAGTFAIMSVYGYFTKKDLTRIGQLCIMALFGLIIASIVNFFMASEQLYWIITYAGVVIFTLLVAYKTQQIKQMNVIGNEGTDEDRKEAIIGALVLYLAFINLFLFLLRLFGSRK